MKALSRMQRKGSSWLMVTRPDGQLAGILSLKDVLKLLSLRMDLEEDSGLVGTGAWRRRLPPRGEARNARL